ncbi:MAG: metallophosphoesterase [Lapillicoccus sp.]
MLTIAHISDLHIGASPQAEARVRAVITHLAAMTPRPDVLVVSGDVADHGLEGEYAVAHDLLALWTGPLVLCPGNHDVREAFASGLLGRPGTGTTGPLDTETDIGRVCFLALDSLVPAPMGERIDHGELSPESLVWLDDRLAASIRPTVVVIHHPPAGLGLPLLEPISLRNADVYAEVIARHGHVLATIVGHAHTACAATLGGRPLLIGGGVYSTLAMAGELGPDVLIDTAPVVAFHYVEDDSIVTHWRALDVGSAGIVR